MIRTIIVELWTGAQIVQRLGSDADDPSQPELDAIATAMTASNDGVRPVVRVVEQFRLPRARGVGGVGGPAGSVPSPPVPR